MNKLKEKLRRGETALGTHIMLNHNATTEMIASLGYDYLWIDTEHASTSLEQVTGHLLAARSMGVPAIVRVPWNDPVRLKPILEMGPEGILAPMVNSADEARRFVDACLYPPKGSRGFGPQHANFFGRVPLDEYLKNAEEDMMRLIQIEHVKAVRALDEILAVEGIDAYIIGPMDLSGSIGKLGQLEDPEVNALLKEIVTTVHAAGKIAGVSFGMTDAAGIRKWKDLGVDMISLGCESDYILAGASKQLKDLRDIMLG
ncbi:MAG: 4-hydroxy-3-methylbut-2-en-1-yl diphosphate synthase [Lachnospiraceae bacterium]|nr:4-hydroxy-3-methylbut-2-en-1-yl diphosphate synthase [Lachnospiraceae bacterium]